MTSSSSLRVFSQAFPEDLIRAHSFVESLRGLLFSKPSWVANANVNFIVVFMTNEWNKRKWKKISTYQYRVKTTYITTFFFFLLLCFPEHCFCCLCLLFYPILYSFLFYSLLACVVILSHCVSFFLLSFCLNVERIVKLNLFQPILKKGRAKAEFVKRI